MGVLNNELTINRATNKTFLLKVLQSHVKKCSLLLKNYSSEINLDHSRKYISYHLQHQITIFHVVVMSKLSKSGKISKQSLFCSESKCRRWKCSWRWGCAGSLSARQNLHSRTWGLCPTWTQKSFFARLSRLIFYTVAPRSQMHCKEGKQIAKCCKSSQNATEEFLGR